MSSPLSLMENEPDERFSFNAATAPAAPAATAAPAPAAAPANEPFNVLANLERWRAERQRANAGLTYRPRPTYASPAAPAFSAPTASAAPAVPAASAVPVSAPRPRRHSNNRTGRAKNNNNNSTKKLKKCVGNACKVVGNAAVASGRCIGAACSRAAAATPGVARTLYERALVPAGQATARCVGDACGLLRQAGVATGEGVAYAAPIAGRAIGQAATTVGQTVGQTARQVATATPGALQSTYHGVLAPTGRVIGQAATTVGQTVGQTARQVAAATPGVLQSTYHGVLAPTGRALGQAGVTLGRAVQYDAQRLGQAATTTGRAVGEQVGLFAAERGFITSFQNSLVITSQDLAVARYTVESMAPGPERSQRLNQQLITNLRGAPGNQQLIDRVRNNITGARVRMGFNAVPGRDNLSTYTSVIFDELYTILEQYFIDHNIDDPNVQSFRDLIRNPPAEIPNILRQIKALYLLKKGQLGETLQFYPAGHIESNDLSEARAIHIAMQVYFEDTNQYAIDYVDDDDLQGLLNELSRERPELTNGGRRKVSRKGKSSRKSSRKSRRKSRRKSSRKSKGRRKGSRKN